jgi:CRISPR-associated protein Cas1
MTSLYVDRRGVTLKADGEALVFYENGERIGTVPLAPLSRVFMRGDVTLSSALLGKLGERGIGVVVLSGRKAMPTMLLGRPHNDAARRVAQYRLSLDEPFCLRFARAIVEAKLRAHAGLLAERRDSEPQSRYLLTCACGVWRRASRRSTNRHRSPRCAASKAPAPRPTSRASPTCCRRV